jgi:hypothetical protein
MAVGGCLVVLSGFSVLSVGIACSNLIYGWKQNGEMKVVRKEQNAADLIAVH